jgi:hypothetical protein
MEKLINKIIEAFESFFESVLQYLTNILSFTLIIVVGFVLGHVLKVLSQKFFKLIRLDAHSERSEFTDMLRRGGITEPTSVLLSRLVGWLTVFVFFIIALGALQVPQVEHLLGEFFVYVPNILVAVVIVFIGYMLSNFLGKAMLIACVNAGVKASGLISKLARVAVLILTASMALEQLGIGSETIIAAFTIIFGGIVLTLALAFGLGARDLAKEYLELKFKKPEEPTKVEKEDEISHL